MKTIVTMIGVLILATCYGWKPMYQDNRKTMQNTIVVLSDTITPVDDKEYLFHFVNILQERNITVINQEVEYEVNKINNLALASKHDFNEKQLIKEKNRKTKKNLNNMEKINRWMKKYPDKKYVVFVSHLGFQKKYDFFTKTGPKKNNLKLVLNYQIYKLSNNNENDKISHEESLKLTGKPQQIIEEQLLQVSESNIHALMILQNVKSEMLLDITNNFVFSFLSSIIYLK